MSVSVAKYVLCADGRDDCDCDVIGDCDDVRRGERVKGPHLSANAGLVE